MNIGVRCQVSGRVQGVFFRAATRDQARRLGLSGWVRNLPTGDVEVVACGSAEGVAKLRAWLWQGPELAWVSAVDCASIPLLHLEGFEIR